MSAFPVGRTCHTLGCMKDDGHADEHGMPVSEIDALRARLADAEAKRETLVRYLVAEREMLALDAAGDARAEVVRDAMDALWRELTTDEIGYLNSRDMGVATRLSDAEKALAFETQTRERFAADREFLRENQRLLNERVREECERAERAEKRASMFEARAIELLDERERALANAEGPGPFVSFDAHLAECNRLRECAEAAEKALADARANHLDAPDSPRCACGLPSAHEDGACSRCRRLADAEAKLAAVTKGG